MASYYILANTSSEAVRWYQFSYDEEGNVSDVRLMDVLNLTRVAHFRNKAAAKEGAKAAGLKTWRYFKVA